MGRQQLQAPLRQWQQPPLAPATLLAATGWRPVLQSPRYDRPREQTLGRGHT